MGCDAVVLSKFLGVMFIQWKGLAMGLVLGFVEIPSVITLGDKMRAEGDMEVVLDSDMVYITRGVSVCFSELLELKSNAEESDKKKKNVFGFFIFILGFFFFFFFFCFLFRFLLYSI